MRRKHLIQQGCILFYVKSKNISNAVVGLTGWRWLQSLNEEEHSTGGFQPWISRQCMKSEHYFYIIEMEKRRHWDHFLSKRPENLLFEIELPLKSFHKKSLLYLLTNSHTLHNRILVRKVFIHLLSRSLDWVLSSKLIMTLNMLPITFNSIL